MFRHPIPLNTLCHHEANIAYDKLAVISDHIDELANVADCILDLKEYLFHILKLYVTLAKDETITGEKKFTKPITTTRVNLYNEVDETDNIAFIETGWDKCAPYVDLHVDREDSQSHERYKANIRLLLDPCDNYKAKFIIPYTDGEEDYSAVCVKYLEEQLDIIRTRIAALEDRVSTAEKDIDNLEDRATQVEGRVSQVETRIDNWPPDKDTTYSFALENGRLVIRTNDGTTQTVDLASISGNAGTQVGQTFRVGMIRSCFCINGWKILPGDLISGSWLIYGNHEFQVEDDDKQWSLCAYFGEHREFCTLKQAISNGWTLPSNTTWVALAPCYGMGYASTHGLFMCVEVR